jgi:ATP-dependent Clp protease protease subunit
MEQVLDISNEPNRILYLSGDIEDQNVSNVCSQILAVNQYDNKMLYRFRQYEIQPIQLHIQSFGGSVQDMWAIIDTIESSSTPIVTYCSGYCMSAAALIFIAGHYRYMYKHSSIMFHQMSVGSFGKINDFKLGQCHFDSMHDEMIKYIKKHTKLKKKFFKKFDKNKEDVYLTAKECKKFGICDEIQKKTDNRGAMKAVMKQAKCQDEDF